MRLRLRLAVTTLGVTAPMIVALTWLDARARHQAAAEALSDVASRTLLEAGERGRCERSPATWGGVPLRPPEDRGRTPPPPPRGARPGGAPPVLFAYDRDLASQNPRAPEIPAALAGRIREQDVATDAAPWPGSSVDVVVRMPWRDGPCAVILAHGTTSPGWIGALLPASRVWLAPVVVLFAAVLAAVGPALRRLRQLAEAVRRSAAGGFSEPVAMGGRDEIHELSLAFDAAAREVRTQLAEKDRRAQALRDFLANTTHDVMIPLTVLQHHLASLKEGADAGEALDKVTLTSAMDEAHYIGALLHNLAIAAKLDAGRQDLLRDAVDLNALVGRALSRHRPIARQLDISLDSAVPEPPVVVDADVTLLEQAVSNVIYNAIRHNRPGGHVAVILERTGEDRFRVRVLDDGPGIPAAELPHLLERGARGDRARTRSPDGQGLGLHITCRVADLHGFSIQLGPSELGGLQVDIEGREVGDN